MFIKARKRSNTIVTIWISTSLVLRIVILYCPIQVSLFPVIFSNMLCNNLELHGLGKNGSDRAGLLERNFIDVFGVELLMQN